MAHIKEQSVLTGHWLYSQRRADPYLYVPFDMPAGVRSLTVAYRTSLWSDAGREHVDIGLFDPAGHAFCDAPGFRGWSGSARDRFFVSEDCATPGYVAGPLPAGTWHIVLGTESRKCDDVEYTIELEFRAAPTPPEAKHQPPFSQGVLRTGARYYQGDLHCHTVHSDGTHPLETVAQRAQDRGLDFLSITNHNVVATGAALTPEWLDAFLLIGGEEVTTYRGHLNVWGIRDWMDFRASTDSHMAAIVAEAHARGALTSINHPRQGGPDWEFALPPEVPCLEVWNGPWPANNYECVAVYDRLLCEGRRVTAVGGSDIHVISMPDAPYLYELGNPTTHVYAEELSERGILAGLRSGRVCVTAEPGEPWAELRATAGGESAVMGDALSVGGTWKVTVDTRDLDDCVVQLMVDGQPSACVPVAEARALDIPAPEYYVRAQVMREPAAAPEDWFVLALTNPVYRDPP